MSEWVNCNLCGADDASPLFRLRDYRLQIDEIEWSAVRCRHCGLGYLNPRPTAKESERYYPPAYFEHRATQMERYERQANYVPGPPGRLLDIGTARGDFPAVMQRRGWDAEGLEPALAGNPHDVKIHRIGFPDGCDLPGGAYDVVTAWAVFEHLHDPASAFKAACELLRPGGRLVLQVPNLRSIYAQWALQEDVPRHLYFFDPSTLRHYANRSGLKLDSVVHTTDLFGGSGRGVLRLLLLRALGKSTAEFFEVWRSPRRERFRKWPMLAAVWTATSALESLVLADSLIRRAGISGQIVAYLTKPRTPSI